MTSKWLTNIEHGKLHEPLDLMTMEENLRFWSKKIKDSAYPKYDNYDAVEVCETMGIPSDYDGVVLHSAAVGRNMRRILKKMLTASIRDSKISKCKMITIPLEESARFAQQGPAWGTQEWEEIYRPARNAIESKNSYIKDRAIALGDKNRRFVRGGAATFMMIAFGAVSLNVNLIQPLITRVSDPTYKPRKVVSQPYQRIGPNL